MKKRGKQCNLESTSHICAVDSKYKLPAWFCKIFFRVAYGNIFRKFFLFHFEHAYFIHFALKKHRKEVPLTFELHSILTCKIRIAAATFRFVV